MTNREEALAELAGVVNAKRGNGERIETAVPNTWDTQFQAKSAELVEALEPSQEEIANLQRRYWELKFGIAYVVEATGEAFTKEKYEAEVAGVGGQLRAYVLAHGAIPAHGDVPALKLTERNKDHADAPTVFAEDSEVFYALLWARALTIDCKLAAKVLDPDQAGRFKRWVHKLGAGDALGFDRVTR